MLVAAPAAQAMSLNFEQIKFTTDPGVTITMWTDPVGGTKDPSQGYWSSISLAFPKFQPIEDGRTPASGTVTFKGSDEELPA